MKYAWSVLVFLIVGHVQAQVRFAGEIGIGVGAFNYIGDLTPNYQIKNLNPGAVLFYRASVSSIVSFRSSFSYGKISGKEIPIDAAARLRNASFSRSISNIDFGFEYHFLDWRDNLNRLRFSPFIHAGVGFFGLSNTAPKPVNYSNVQLSIPFGVGIKYVITPRYYLALEWGVRKTFFDYIDNVSDGDVVYKNYQYGSPSNYDTYFFTCFSINYTFYEIPCAHTPYRKGVFGF